jgi:Tol biopolymer transport system component
VSPTRTSAHCVAPSRARWRSDACTGRSPSRIERLSAAVLHERVAFGVDSGAMSARQGRLLLRRQVSQLPRWLAQVRYNGPPPTHLGKLTRKPRDFAANPALSDDGARVVFEAYLQKLPLALKKGEISVLEGSAAGAPARSVSFNSRRRTPRSAYNPTVSGDGRRVAYESAEGNLNFAKRYGQIHVFIKDTRSGRTTKMPLPAARAGVSRSEYNPVIAAGGRHIAYQAQRRGGQSAVYVTDLRSGRATLASRSTRSAAGANDGVYDPAISGDGSKVAFTTAASQPRRRRPRRAHAGLRPRPRCAHDDARQPRRRRARRDRRRLLG